MHKSSKLSLLILLWTTPLCAQATPAAIPTDAAQVQQMIKQVGCDAEVNATSQTIVNLQKQVDALKKELAKKGEHK